MRKISILVLILSSFLGANAQSQLGIKAGTNFFALHSSNNEQLDYATGKFGYVFGLTYELPVSKNFSVQPELNYSYQVAKETYYGSNIHLTYVQVPVMFQFHPTNARIKIYGGPQVAFLSNAKIKYDDATPTKNVNNQMVQTDFGFAGGIGTTPCKGGYSLDLRVYKGMTNVFRAVYDNGTKSRPTLISLTIGYRFGSKK